MNTDSQELVEISFLILNGIVSLINKETPLDPVIRSHFRYFGETGQV